MAAFVITGKPEDYIGNVYENANKKTHCVTFVQAVLTVPLASLWKKGVQVEGNEATIVSGTLIATFDKDGNYPNKPSGNHAAFFIGKENQMMKVLDQYVGSGGVKFSRYRYLSAEKRADLVKSGKYSMTADPSTYFVVQTFSQAALRGGSGPAASTRV